MQMARTIKNEPSFFGEFSDSDISFSPDAFPLNDLEAFKDIFSGNIDEAQLFANFKEEDLFGHPFEADLGMMQQDIELRNESSFEYQSDSNDIYTNPYDSCDNGDDDYEFDNDDPEYNNYDSCSNQEYDNYQSRSCHDYDEYEPEQYDESGHESTDSEVTLRLTPIVGGKSCPEALSKYQKRINHERAAQLPSQHPRFPRQELPRQTATRNERLPKKDNMNRKKESEIYLELTKVLMGLQKVKPELQLFDTKLKSRQPSRLVTMQACRKLFNTNLISASKTKKKAMIMRQKFIKELSEKPVQNVDLRRAIELKISQCETIIRETSHAQ